MSKNKTSIRPNRGESDRDEGDFLGEGGGAEGMLRRGGPCEPVFDKGWQGRGRRRPALPRSIEIGGPSGLVLNM